MKKQPLPQSATLPQRPSLVQVASALAGYGFHLLCNIVFIALFPPFMLLFIWNPSLQRRAGQAIYRGYCHFLTRIWLPFVGVLNLVEESGFPEKNSHDPAIFIANHRSRLDGLFIIPLLPETGVLIKSQYARFPLFTHLVRYLDFVSVDPHSIDSLTAAMESCKVLLRSGKRLLVFPEGTRAAGGRINQFKDLAFRLAIDTNTPIIPVVIHTDLPVMAKIKGSIFPPRTLALTIRALEKQLPQPGESAVHFADRVRRKMMETIRELDRGTVWERERSSFAPAQALFHPQGKQP
jgi:1-acyl-sn-glycerol-3-phosphate acyltransferase